MTSALWAQTMQDELLCLRPFGYNWVLGSQWCNANRWLGPVLTNQAGRKAKPSNILYARLKVRVLHMACEIMQSIKRNCHLMWSGERESCKNEESFKKKVGL